MGGFSKGCTYGEEQQQAAEQQSRNTIIKAIPYFPLAVIGRIFLQRAGEF